MRKIPAIKGKIGDTVYYTANLTFKQVAEMVVRLTDEIHTSATLKDAMQRSLSDNFIRIKEYILTHQDRFLNSLVLAVYDGEPKWTEIRYELDEEDYANVGILSFTGKEVIFPVDGQHRVEGIKASIQESAELMDETIPVMLIGHSKTSSGMEKSRRIFSTLNRYAKPVLLGDIIALDEDDAVAIVTRDLIEHYPLFNNNRIKINNSKSIPQGDKQVFTSLITLYSCHLELFKSHLYPNMSDTKVKETLKARPTDEILRSFNEYVTNFWDIFTQTFAEIQEYISNLSETAAVEYRSQETGGNILFRPVSLLPLIQAIMLIHKRKGISIMDIFNKYSSLNRCVSSELWSRVIWDPHNNRMIVNSPITIKLLLSYVFDPEVLSDREQDDLFSRYALLLNIDPSLVSKYLEQFIL